MKALIFNQTGNPVEVLSLEEIAKPAPAPDEVLIKVLASPINPSDSFFIQGTYRLKPEFPQIAGLEGAGRIEAAGHNVHLSEGTLVAFTFKGTWAEYVTVPADSVILLPKNFPVEKAAQFYLNPTTAWGLLDEAKVEAGDWLLLTAANASVSRIVIQLARLRNIKVIGIIRDLKQAEELKNMGAEEVLKQDDNLSDRVNEITSGKGIDAALDAVGGKTGTQVLKSLKAKGRLIIYGLLSKDPVQFHNSLVIYKNLEIKGFGIRGYLQSQSPQQRTEMIKLLIEAIKNPSFQLPVESTFHLNQFKEALEAGAKGGRKGKIIFSNP